MCYVCMQHVLCEAYSQSYCMYVYMYAQERPDSRLTTAKQRHLVTRISFYMYVCTYVGTGTPRFKTHYSKAEASCHKDILLCMYICMYVCTSIVSEICLFLYLYMYVYMYASTYVRKDIFLLSFCYIYIYIYIHT